MHDRLRLEMYPNKNYENDIKYTTQLNRVICNLLGIWPDIETSFLKNFKNVSLILSCIFLLITELIPTILYVVYIEKRFRIRMILIPSIMFTTSAVIKYFSLMLNKNQVGNCLTQVKDDWRNVVSASARRSMINKARTARHLIVLCCIFMYSAGFYFRTIVPLYKGKSVTDQNITIRHLPCASYFILFNGQISPAYEIIFFMQFASGFIKYTITVAICSLAALFVMHVCGQLEILMALIENLVNETDEKNLDRMLGMAVEHQIKMRNFLRLVQSTLEHTSLLEITGCTIFICLLGHSIITEWENQNVVSMCSYVILLTSMSFNIYIFCFIGEQLSIEGEKLAVTVCTLAWYRFPNAKARELILVIAMSIVPTKLKAGKFFELSIRTFGDVSNGYFRKYDRLTLEMYPNKNYENDIKYTTQLNRVICRLLGIWPDTEPSFFKNLKSVSLILSCSFLLASELIPTILYVVFIEKRFRVRLKLISSILFTTTAVLKYFTLVLSKNQVRNCLTRVKDDWRNVVSASARHSMINKARTAKRLLILCGIFMYTSGLYFRTIVPLSKGKSVTDQNITIKHLPCPSYFVLFNGQISPAYEIIFFIQFFSGFIKYTITVAICSLAALFVMHVCGQLEILMALIDNLVNKTEERDLDRMLAMTVEHQINMRNFLRLVQSTLEHTSMLEVTGCTIIICLLGHDIITEWEDQNVVSMCSYIILLTSIGFNIYIFCFIGEQLSVEGEKLAITVCTLAWYRLPNEKARALILVIAMSIVPTKLKAGKFFDLSIRTFGDVSNGYFLVKYYKQKCVLHSFRSLRWL
ncbi:uncharacterized protein LOC105195325 [Solenopsis invicta]|uniref:uncharacterized protein LOC105195325 n=1 Tax=Solenopsis invicta TaxID=13686 RepID=UPI00193E5B7E|nr:uncharacterized protein LOC105195325 [Solenopsis invicta]